MSKGDIYPESCQEVLERWDKGEIVYSVEMGGLGPSYEMTIQVSVFELMRAFNCKPPEGTDDEIQASMNQKLRDLNHKFDFGHSGASAGASIWLAYKFMKDGYKKAMLTAPDNRRILIDKKHWDFKK